MSYNKDAMNSNFERFQRSHSQLKAELFNGYNEKQKQYRETGPYKNLHNSTSSQERLADEQQRNRAAQRIAEQEEIERLRKTLGIDKANPQRSRSENVLTDPQNSTPSESWNDFLKKESRLREDRNAFNASVENLLDPDRSNRERHDVFWKTIEATDFKKIVPEYSQEKLERLKFTNNKETRDEIDHLIKTYHERKGL